MVRPHAPQLERWLPTPEIPLPVPDAWSWTVYRLPQPSPQSFGWREIIRHAGTPS